MHLHFILECFPLKNKEQKNLELEWTVVHQRQKIALMVHAEPFWFDGKLLLSEENNRFLTCEKSGCSYLVVNPCSGDAGACHADVLPF